MVEVVNVIQLLFYFIPHNIPIIIFLYNSNSVVQESNTLDLFVGPVHLTTS